jgi:glycosyltransferase involved in cell wall biosynthesis
MRPIHVLHVIDGLKVSGAETLLRDLLARLPRDRYRVSVCYSTPGPMADELMGMGIPLTRLPRLGRLDPLLTLRLAQVMRRDPPQVVHTHLFKSDFHGRIAARLTGVPVVVSSLHNCDRWAQNPVLGWIYGWTAGLADRLIAVSEDVRLYAIKYTFVRPDRVVTVHSAVPLEKYAGCEEAGRALRREMGIAEQTPLLGMIARLAAQKDHATLLEALARLRSLVPGVRALIVGDGPLRAALSRQAESLGLGDVVTFTGMRRDIPAILAALDVFVLSTHWEGLPVALLEAMAASRPVVASSVAGVPGVVDDGVTGLIVAHADPSALAEACAQLLRDPDRAKRMGAAGRQRVAAHYSAEQMLAGIQAQYEGLLAGAGLGGSDD